nr:MAG TPA: hypothetical protein [Caudoviricetes sp.]
MRKISKRAKKKMQKRIERTKTTPQNGRVSGS